MKSLFLILSMVVSFVIFVEGAVVGGAAVFAYANKQQAVEAEAHQAALEAEYYRGLYDVCMVTGREQESCLTALATFKRKHWFEQESSGYEWPLPAEGRLNATLPHPLPEGGE